MATEAPAVSPVLDDETLFRVVRDEPMHFGCDGKGALTRLSHSAFNDPDMQPSVDRAVHRIGGAAESRKSASDGVVALVAVEVRSIKTLVSLDAKGRPAQSHWVDVVHAPEVENYSHALVRTAPQIASGGAFKRLKEALCFLAAAKGWAYPPESARG
jgi:hypothetical protein